MRRNFSGQIGLPDASLLSLQPGPWLAGTESKEQPLSADACAWDSPSRASLVTWDFSQLLCRLSVATSLGQGNEHIHTLHELLGRCQP